MQKKLQALSISNLKLSKTDIAVSVHLLIIVVAYYLLYIFGDRHILPTDGNTVRYDAYWYFTLIDEGYIYEPGLGNGLAFFPLFPVVWYWSGLTALGISFFNYAVFAGTFIFLLKDEKLSYAIQLTLLAFPSFIFFALPYSESLFFLFSTFIILGYRRNNNRLLYIGLFGASLVRSVCMLFVPAIIIVYFVNSDKELSKKQRLINCGYQLAATIGGFLAASLYMGVKSGKWFYFIEIQKYWQRHWIIPKFPLTTYSADRILGLDGVTFMLGLIAACLCCKWMYLFIKQNGLLKTYKIDRAVLFSALYLAGMTTLDTIFTRNLGNATSIWSLNRHAMCTPFAITFIIYLYRDFWPKAYELIALITLLAAGVFITGAYHFVNLRVLGFFVLFFLNFFIIKYKTVLTNYFVLYYLVSVFLQIKFYEDFIAAVWVG